MKNDEESILLTETPENELPVSWHERVSEHKIGQQSNS